MYKFFIYAPDDSEIILKIIDATSKAGAGTVGNYSHCAFVTKGYGTWYSLPGSDPEIGEVGELTKADEVKIEMECPKEKMHTVFEAIRAIHPYDKISVDAVDTQRFE